jgi:chaperonin GroES
MLKVIGNRVAIKPDEFESKTKSGIFIPETSKEKPQQGTVVDVGEGRTLESGVTLEPKVKVGDKVVYSRYLGQEVIVNEGESFVIVDEKDILCIL